MSDSFFDKFIADLVKGANANSRENGGPGVNIIVDRENRGREEKLAAFDAAYNDGVKAAIFATSNPASAAQRTIGGAGSMVKKGPPPVPAPAIAKKGPPPLPAAALAKMHAESPFAAKAAADRFKISAGFGQAAASLLGKGMGMAGRNPLAATAALGAGVGALGGAMGAESGHRLEGAAKGGLTGGALGLGAGMGAGSLLRNHPGNVVQGMMSRTAAVKDRYDGGTYAALQAFDVKTAFLGMAGSLLGGTLLKKALPGVAKRVGPGIGGHAMEAAGSMLGGTVGSRLETPRQPQQPQGLS